MGGIFRRLWWWEVEEEDEGWVGMWRSCGNMDEDEEGKVEQF